MVWGAFTFLKLSTLPRISHRLDEQGYIQLLKDNLLPFLKEFPPGKRVFQQDNAPIHTAKATSSFLVSNGIRLIKWPPQLPDLNPIEHLWDELDRITRKKMAATNKFVQFVPFPTRSMDIHFERLFSEVV